MRAHVAFAFMVASMGTFSAAAYGGSSQADVRYEEGRAFAKKRDWENARQSFAQAVLLEPNDLRYVWNLAISESKTNRAVEALRHFRKYAHHAQAMPDDKRQALHFIVELERQTARITIDAPKLVQVYVDDEDCGLTPIDAVDVTPGAHSVVGKNGRGQTQKVVVRAAKGGFIVAKLDFGSEPTAQAPPPVATIAPPPVAAPTRSRGGPPVLTYILGGVAVASAAAGAILLTNAHSAADDAAKIRGSNPAGFCNDRSTGACRSLVEANDSASARGTGATILLVTAGVALAGAAMSWIAWPHPRGQESSTWVTPQIGEGRVGIAAGGSF
jgi:hypothetical protein